MLALWRWQQEGQEERGAGGRGGQEGGGPGGQGDRRSGGQGRKRLGRLQVAWDGVRVGVEVS